SFPLRPHPTSTLFPYTTLFRSPVQDHFPAHGGIPHIGYQQQIVPCRGADGEKAVFIGDAPDTGPLKGDRGPEEGLPVAVVLDGPADGVAVLAHGREKAQ